MSTTENPKRNIRDIGDLMKIAFSAIGSLLATDVTACRERRWSQWGLAFAYLLSYSNLQLVAADGVEGALDVDTQKIELPEDVFVEFTSEFIAAKEREIHLAGYTVYRAALWKTDFTIPHSMMTEGWIVLAGKRIRLDVSSLAEGWVKGDRIARGHCKLERLGKSGDVDILSLKVCFLKGGAADYMVEWIVAGDQSMRVGIVGLGDTLPDWVDGSE